jgi:GTPase SAR1 family protein
LEGAIKWKEDIDAKVSRVGEETVPVLLVGNKCDLKKEGATSEEELDRLAAQHSFCGTCVSL